eukprot:CAMPEP_0179304202 /NCGR_PEP_ID=MMETSP0797-20121207/48974_1 /TAXON_ID=47934 /ORGANISM="Dinophysis acuminata, Strain DAEP01" /LENGTH=479 /DNA_ID=CAMNT_0021013787 /DNA_START=73 /DNA_END=1509 /DNA_ORIENTATION=-
MSAKGGSSWRTGAGSRPVPSSSPANPEAVGSKGRKLISDKRVMGCVNEWSNNFGWIVPLQKIDHPQARKSQGRIYLHMNDVRNSKPLTPGTHVDFFLYCDMRGLGAGDCRAVQPGGEAAEEPEAPGDLEEGPLPEGWEKVWSAEHSEFYYWHKASKESSWTRPEPTGGLEDDGDEVPLPEGWEKHFDPEHNEWYYWHRSTKSTTWERPSAPSLAAAPGAGGPGGGAGQQQEEAEPEAQPAAEGPVLGQQRIRGSVTSWNGFFGWIAPSGEVGDDLKPLLEQHQDKIYVNWRDVEGGAALKAGSDVDFLLYADDNGLGASDCRLYVKESLKETKKRGVKRGGAVRDTMAELEKQWAQQDAELAEGGAAEAVAAAEPAPAAPPGAPEADDESPLLPGWVQHWSEEHQCNFYWHKATKQSSWERPAVPSDGPAGGDARADNQGVGGRGDGGGRRAHRHPADAAGPGGRQGDDPDHARGRGAP